MTYASDTRFCRTASVLFAVFLPPSVLIAVRISSGLPFEGETALMYGIHRHIGDGFFPIAAALHYLGKTAIAVPLIVLAAWLLYRAGKARAAWFCILAALLPTLNMLLLKMWFARPRPQLWIPPIPETNFSFPSGHSTFSAAVAVMLFAVFRRTPYRYAACVAGILFALLTGFSRVWLGVHYPTDVWAGWTNGLLTALLVYRFVLMPSERTKGRP